jgi:hypothetical protein
MVAARFPWLLAAVLGLLVGPALPAVAHADHDPSASSVADGTVPTGIEDRPLPEREMEDADRFGQVVALSEDGSLLAVGAPSEDVDGVVNAGAVHVFEREAGEVEWSYLTRVTAPEPEDTVFGSSVAINDRLLVVGDPDATLESGRGGGKAFVYAVSALGGDDAAVPIEIPAPRGSGSTAFGASVALDGERFVVGDFVTGNLDLYRYDGGEEVHETVFGPAGPRDSARFGSSDTIGFDGDVLVAGDIGFSNASVPSWGGAVFVYRFDGGNDAWVHGQTLTSPEPQSWGLFGHVDVDGGVLVVGEPGSTGDDGRVHVYEASAADRSAWDRVTTLEPSEPAGNLGEAVAVEDGVIVAGAPEEREQMRGVNYVWSSVRNVGAVYWFAENASGEWERTSMVRAPVPLPLTISIGNMFGESVALSGSRAVAGGVGVAEHPERVDPSIVGEEPDWTGSGRVTVFGPDRDRDHLGDARERAVGTPVGVGDADDDGLVDGLEVVRWLSDPFDADTDNDTLTDGEEAWEYYTETRDPDTDGDGFSDAFEIEGISAAGEQVVEPSDPIDHRDVPLVPVGLVSPYQRGSFEEADYRRDVLPVLPVDQPGHWPAYVKETVADAERETRRR